MNMDTNTGISEEIHEIPYGDMFWDVFLCELFHFIFHQHFLAT